MSFLGPLFKLSNPHSPNWWLLKQRKTQFGANKTRPGIDYAKEAELVKFLAEGVEFVDEPASTS
jgi:hypothetical protein